MSAPIIKQCTCVSEYQDKVYGRMNRVCTPGKSESCTVCGASTVSGVSNKKK